MAERKIPQSVQELEGFAKCARVFYVKGFWTESMVRDMVNVGKITEHEANLILS